MQFKKYTIFGFLLFFILLLISAGKKTETEIRVMNFEELKPLLEKNTDTTYIVNFWATWCAPCIAEIPYFEQVGEKYKDEKVKIFMVSLDFPSHINSRLVPFMEKEKMKNEVVLLDDPNSNRWIPLVDKNWTGAIPATLIYTKNKRKFIPNELTFSELDSIVNKFNLSQHIE